MPNQTYISYFIKNHMANLGTLQNACSMQFSKLPFGVILILGPLPNRLDRICFKELLS